MRDETRRHFSLAAFAQKKDSAGNSIPDRETFMTKKAKTRVGIIGAGGISGVHLPSLRDIDAAELVAVCDIERDRAEKASADFDIPMTYTLYREMLQKESLDAVFVLTQPDQLFRPVLDCLRAGKHVFMEKPPGVTVCQSLALLRAARKNDKILQVGFNRRFIPIVSHVVDLMKKHTPITQVEGRFIKHGEASFYDGSGSAFECDTIHAIDLVRWIADGEPIAAAMVEGQHDDVIPNRWNAVVRFDNDVTGIVKANYQTGARVHTLEIHGPGGSAFVDLGFGDDSCSAEVLLFGGQGTYSLASTGSATQQRISLDGRELAKSEEFRIFYGFAAEDEHFIECVQNGSRPLTDIEEGVKTLQFVDFLRENRI
jgi:predicted dehydrogenase